MCHLIDRPDCLLRSPSPPFAGLQFTDDHAGHDKRGPENGETRMALTGDPADDPTPYRLAGVDYGSPGR